MIDICEDDCRKQCLGACGKAFKKGDIIVTAFGSAYMGNVSIRWWHLGCFVKSDEYDKRLDQFFKCEKCGKVRSTNEKCSKCKRIKVVSSL